MSSHLLLPGWHAKIALLDKWNSAISDGGVPSKPTLVLTDNADGTGFTAKISDYDPGTTNTLYVGRVDQPFTSKGSSWVDDEIHVSADLGDWLAYVVSSNAEGETNSDIEEVTVTDLADAPHTTFLRGYMTDTLTLKIRTRDQWGTSTDVETTLPCRIYREFKEVTDDQGAVKLSSARILTDLATIGVQDVLNFDSRDHSIIKIVRKGSFTTNRHYEIYVA